MGTTWTAEQSHCKAQVAGSTNPRDQREPGPGLGWKQVVTAWGRTLIVHVLCARDWVRCFSCIILFNPHNDCLQMVKTVSSKALASMLLLYGQWRVNKATISERQKSHSTVCISSVMPLFGPGKFGAIHCRVNYLHAAHREVLGCLKGVTD